MCIQLTDKQRIDIIKFIVAHPLFLGKLGQEEGGIVDFLEMLWELRTLPSKDSRYNNAYDDAWQHLVRNNDWEYEELFLNRFPDTYRNEDTFEKFISYSVHPSLYDNDGERRTFIEAINAELSKVSCRLVGVDYFEGRVVYKVAPMSELHDQLPEDIVENDIPFYYGNNTVKRYPCFELIEDGWDDWFTYKTKFKLSYRLSEGDCVDLGMLKLMKRGVNKTAEALPPCFLRLTEEWCSIGMNFDYYSGLKSRFERNYQSILYALRDTALFPTVYEAFENDPCFNNSLIRHEPFNSNPAPLLDSVRYRLQGLNVDNYYKFRYSYRPPYASDTDDGYTTIDFNFTYNIPLEQRIYGIIGKNGSGKTTLLSKMAKSFQSAGDHCIMPAKPLYNKVMSISFSMFDTFPLPVGNARFNYRYLGLRDKSGDRLENLRLGLRGHLEGINAKSRSRFWFSFLREVLHEQLADIIAKEKEEDRIDVDGVMSSMEKLSSGENLLIYVFTSLLDEIKQNTLILFDEPEMHLHPNAIASLIRYLYRLLEQFNSFCILATHSPLVIQEIPSDNVIIFRREGNSLVVQPLPYETFSQDLSMVTESVFGDTRSGRYHYQMFRHLVEHIGNYDKILNILNNSNRPVPLGTRMLLKTMLEKNA